MLGCSPKEWATNMMKEGTQLDTLALIAIRNMLDVSLPNISFCTKLNFLGKNDCCVIRNNGKRHVSERFQCNRAIRKTFT